MTCIHLVERRSRSRAASAIPTTFRRAYRDQAAFITRRIEETIDRILAESPEPPIIILQSDHGSELNLDMYDVQHTDLHERMSILNAYYFPGGRYEGLYEGITPGQLVPGGPQHVLRREAPISSPTRASSPPGPIRTSSSTSPTPVRSAERRAGSSDPSRRRILHDS